MGLCSWKQLSILAVVLLSLASANIFHTLEERFNRVENVKSQLEQAPLESVRRWARLISAVKHMSVDIPFTLISPQKNRPKQKVPSLQSSGFSWASCGSSDQLVEIRNLSVTPSPLYFPGQLSFGFDIVFHDTITKDAGVSASLLFEHNKGSGSWIKFPCIQGIFGSCTYYDVCMLSRAIVCPDELKKRGIPCTCPIYKGEYKLPNLSVDVGASFFPPGDYRSKIVFDSFKGQIACYNGTFSVG